ncbi:hypothetical protein AQUCO_02100040v1 [Aquilegia coerulea]|uniref:Uncharacterized protein n=1 Tax=Aquilegia coerulea TaxID=218851 RepID=A0A2G5DEI8_AQUCA|nr:hypothetical protein AQUCO_02100040v1 [Aquilegia coerulea]
MNTKSNNSLLLFYGIVFLSCNTNLSIGANNITLGQSLSGNQTIISKGGIFELGFFKQGNTTSDKYYIGIWYKKPSIQTAVWVANRDPVKDPNYSELKFSQDGRLVLLDERGYQQSFDYPTDTWLPGAMLGLTKTRANGTFLTSQQNSDEPGTGNFLLNANTNISGPPVLRYMYVRNYYSRWTYWTWSWNGHNFSLMNSSLSKYVNFSFVSSDEERYFTYSAHNTSIPIRLVMDFLGRLQLFTWMEDLERWDSIFAHQTYVDDSEKWHTVFTKEYDYCGINTWSTVPMSRGNNSMWRCTCLKGFESAEVWLSVYSFFGCKRKKALQCHSKGNDAFYVMDNMRLQEIVMHTNDQSISECKMTCLSACSCAAYTYSNSCSIWLGELFSLQKVAPNDNLGKTLYIRVARAEIKSSRAEKLTRIFIIVAVVGFSTVLGLLVIIWNIRWKMMFSVTSGVGFLVSFKYRFLQRATKNFSEELGKGGFGSVFKGTMPDSSAVAVKRLVCSAGEKQFRSEVNTIGMIQHVNLIRLYGFCAEGRERLLVYDYMPNGSLSSYLFRKNSKVLDWKTRYQIALGTARGLAYLHEKCRDCIIHCDIKPENILLDAGLNAKVADFGLAKLLGRDFSRVLTTMRGTRGYLAPEWISGVPITPKADVYSYGMMLFEVISGRRNLDMGNDDMVDYFPAWAAKVTNKGEEVHSLLDQRLQGNADIKELTTASRVACWCIQDDEKDRPSMGEIIQVLEGVSEVPTSPIPSFLQVILHRSTRTKYSTLSSSGVGSNNSVLLQDENTNSWTSTISKDS